MEQDMRTPHFEEAQPLRQDKSQSEVKRDEAQLVRRKSPKLHKKESEDTIALDTSFSRGLAPQRRDNADRQPASSNEMHVNCKLGR